LSIFCNSSPPYRRWRLLAVIVLNGDGVISWGGEDGSVSCVHSSTTYQYNGQHGYDGSPQYFYITPSMTACGSLSFTLYGGGGGGSVYGNGTGGSGGLTTGVIPTNALSSSTLTIIVAGGGQHDSGGDGSFVCLGTQCSLSTVILAAGGGGGANQNYNGGNGGGGNQAGQNGNVGCGSIPQGGTLSAGGQGGACQTRVQPYNNGIAGAGGAGGDYGGGQGTPFSTGGTDPNGNNDNGGYGGGGSGVGGYYGAGGGGGYYRGGGDNNPPNWGFGAGCSGYCASIVQRCGGSPGGAHNGGTSRNPGSNGQVTISW